MEKETKYLLYCGVKRLTKCDLSITKEDQDRLRRVAKRGMQPMQGSTFRKIKRAGEVFSKEVFPNVLITSKIKNVIEIVDGIYDHNQIPLDNLKKAFVDVVKGFVTKGSIQTVIIYAVMAAYAVIRHYLRKETNEHVFNFIEKFAEVLFHAFEICNLIKWFQSNKWNALWKPDDLGSAVFGGVVGIIIVGGILVACKLLQD